MNALSIVNKVVSLVSYNVHKTRLDAVTATVTSIGRGINTKAFEKHRIKRADRLLSNPHLLNETPLIYASICQLFCGSTSRPVISIDWSDLDDCKAHFLLGAAISLKGQPITLYQEVHCNSNKTKEKPATHKAFLKTLHAILPSHCRPIIVTDAGYKSPWFREDLALGWDVVGRVRKPHFYSLNSGNSWQCIRHLYAQATCRPVDRSVLVTAK